MGIGETLCRALDKLVMRAAGYQVKTACGNLQMCAGLESGIERATHAVGQRRLKRVRARIVETEDEAAAAAEEDEEGSGDVIGGISNLRIETAGTEEEATEGLEEALRMEVEEYGGSKGKEGGGGTQHTLETREFLTKDAEPSGTMLVDAHNGFNELSLVAWMPYIQVES